LRDLLWHMSCGKKVLEFVCCDEGKLLDDVPMVLNNVFHRSPWSAFVFLADKEVSMARRHEKTMTGRIFENILFLEEVFGDKAHADIPNVPVLELAKCFELFQPRTLHANRGRRKSSQRGNREGELLNHRSE
jgi:hypothetical protein